MSTCCVSDLKEFLFLAQAKIEDGTAMLLGKDILKLVTEKSQSARTQRIPKYAEGQQEKTMFFQYSLSVNCSFTPSPPVPK